MDHERTEHQPLVLVIDDEPGILDFLELGLEVEGYRVATATSAAAGLSRAHELLPDAVIVDVGLPDGDGFSLVHSIRLQSEAPIIMLTARGEVEDRVHGLEAGADDYIAKPFHLAELLARLRAHLRRQVRGEDVVRAAGVELHPHAHLARRDGRTLQLTHREFELLELFLRHAGDVLSKEQILDRLWGYAFDPNLVEVYVGYLRRKLGEPMLIETVRGAGYVLREVPR